MAGIASLSSVQNSPSYETYSEVEFPQDAQSVLVLALAHDEAEPELDWWDSKRGSPGNRRLESIAKSLRQWLKEDLNSDAHLLPYHVEKGGIFLKDAAVLAGLGTIGMNNLLITPEFGPRVRLRALLLDAELVPAAPTDFAPCAGCAMPCRSACPQEAFTSGSYRRTLCSEQMERDEANAVIVEEGQEKDLPSKYIKYCRACELACPVGKEMT